MEERRETSAPPTIHEDHIRAEETRHAIDVLFRQIVESIPVPVAVTTPSGEVESLNRPTLEYFGMTFDDLKGWKASDVVHPDDRQRTIAALMEAHEEGHSYNVESRHRRADGTYRWFNVLGLPFRDTQGRVLRWFHIQIDIDDRKRAEVRLAGERRLLEMVASSQPLPHILDALCRYVEEIASDCHCSLYLIDWNSKKIELAVGPTIPATFNDSLCKLPVDPKTGPCGMAACLKTQVITVDVESDPVWQTSPFRQLALAHGLRSCWSTPICSLAGEVLGTFAIYQDKPAAPTSLQKDLIAQVTHIASIAVERKQNEEALMRSEAFLAEGQHLARMGNFAWRVDADQITWSEELYRIFEFEAGTPVSLELIASRVHPEDVAMMQNMVARAHSGASDFEYEHRILMLDGSVKYLHLIAHKTGEKHGVEYIGAVQDVTERRLGEEALSRGRCELEHASRVMTFGTLTASIAHEVNQPLSGIITNATTCLRMLSAEPPNVEGALETARRTMRDGNRASEVIKRLRALFGRKDFTGESIDLNEAALEVIALSRSELQRSQAILRTELAKDLPLVNGDRVQLQQVILNLLLNAADAMSTVTDRSRQLMLMTGLDGKDRVRLSVRDVGIGFEPDQKGKLFDAFYTTKKSGMGIGLSISNSIIERHNGRLWAEPNEGQGATFSFSIPSATEGMIVEPRAEENSTNESMGKKQLARNTKL